jgi:GxxExxY protein
MSGLDSHEFRCWEPQRPKEHEGARSMFGKLSEREEYLARQIVDISIQVHKALGPGLLENVYAKCFRYELQKRGIAFEREKEVAIIYQSLEIDNGLRLDLIVDNLIIVEFKAQDLYHPIWDAQLLSYLRLSSKRLGFLINFHVPLMKDGIKRFIL